MATSTSGVDLAIGLSHTRIESHDWLGPMIITVKAIALGGEFIPLPYLKSSLAAVLTFLETVDKMRANRDDLHDLCNAIVEIIMFLQSAVRSYGTSLKLAGLCENLIACLRVIQEGVEKLIPRTGIRGRFRELLTVLNTRSQIERYRIRVNELRSNFLLVAAIDTNLHVTEARNTIAAPQRSRDVQVVDQFRNIALGDINLLNETAVNKGSKTKVFIARVFREPSLMTIVEYEDETWKRDLELHSSIRHPNVLQLFGISRNPGLGVLMIYHDEIIPLATYRKFRRPSSDLVWVCIEAMLFQQFKGCAQYHYWTGDKNEKGEPATVCVKPNPPRLCLSMPGTGYDLDINKLDRQLSAWHTDNFHAQKIPEVEFPRVTAGQFTAESLCRHLEWRHLFAALVPIWLYGLIPCEIQRKLYLGSAVTDAIYAEEFSPVAFIPNVYEFRSRNWHIRHSKVKFDQSIDGKRFTFPAGSFRAAEMLQNDHDVLLSTCIQMDPRQKVEVHSTWLAQANKHIGREIIEGDTRYRYGVVDALGCLIMFQDKFCSLLRAEGTRAEAHLFPCSVNIRREGWRIGLEFPETDQFYWSLDPLGRTRLIPDESDSLGLPRLRLCFSTSVDSWHEYHYRALGEFALARGVNSYNNDIAELLGSALVEVA
ncbi:hypothetical protein B0H16DRAFT_1823356 [Mycena metata]|uniref:Uncharacterized protein n=1 Tax=Mycena metata TaxID=1033252 RepID=A0AAD7MAU8_9AGAR|nr:hypothetical protein B0H16DRAFT_1823356 [Mycena metata]